MARFGLLIAFLLLVTAQQAVAQTVSDRRALTAVNDALTIRTMGGSNGAVVISGTYTGTNQFEGCIVSCGEVGNWFPVPGTPVAGGAQVTSVTGIGQWTFSVPVSQFRVRPSALASGNPQVDIYFTVSGGGGGGAGGTFTGTIGSVTQGTSPWVSSIPAGVAVTNTPAVTGSFLTDTQLRASPPTVVANAGTNLNTSALATAAKQGDGSQVSQMQGAAKGTTTAGPATTTAAGADRQLVDTVLRDPTTGAPATLGGGAEPAQGTAATDTDPLKMIGCVVTATPALATGVVTGDRARVQCGPDGAILTRPTIQQEVVGGIAHGVADSKAPLTIAGVAAPTGSNPTKVAAGQVTKTYATPSGILYVLPGHPNIQTKEFTYTSAPSANTALITVAAGTRIYLLKASAVGSPTLTDGVDVRIGCATATLSAASSAGVDRIALSHPGVPTSGSGIIESDYPTLCLDDEDIRITTGTISAGTLRVKLTWFTE